MANYPATAAKPRKASAAKGASPAPKLPNGSVALKPRSAPPSPATSKSAAALRATRSAPPSPVIASTIPKDARVFVKVTHMSTPSPRSSRPASSSRRQKASSTSSATSSPTPSKSGKSKGKVVLPSPKGSYDLYSLGLQLKYPNHQGHSTHHYVQNPNPEVSLKRSSAGAKLKSLEESDKHDILPKSCGKKKGLVLASLDIPIGSPDCIPPSEAKRCEKWSPTSSGCKDSEKKKQMREAELRRMRDLLEE